MRACDCGRWVCTVTKTVDGLPTSEDELNRVTVRCANHGVAKLAQSGNLGKIGKSMDEVD